MHNRPIVYFFSDFGAYGPYTGQVEAVISNNTRASFINLLSNAPAADPYRAAYLLAGLFEHLPIKSGFLLAVVDPGVGSRRKVLQLSIGDMLLIGPDNGLFSRLIANHDDAKISVLEKPTTKISNSFHARDWFAPAVVNRINAVAEKTVPIGFEHIVGYDWPAGLKEIIYIDHFGNLVTGMQASAVSKDTVLQVRGKPVGYARTFSATGDNELFWYENSMGLVEIAANGSSAAAQLNAVIGNKVMQFTTSP